MMTRERKDASQPLDLDLIQSRLGSAQSPQQSASGAKLGDELRERRPLGGLEAPAEPDQRPQTVLQHVNEVESLIYSNVYQ